MRVQFQIVQQVMYSMFASTPGLNSLILIIPGQWMSSDTQKRSLKEETFPHRKANYMGLKKKAGSLYSMQAGAGGLERTLQDIKRATFTLVLQVTFERIQCVGLLTPHLHYSFSDFWYPLYPGLRRCGLHDKFVQILRNDQLNLGENIISYDIRGSWQEWDLKKKKKTRT